MLFTGPLPLIGMLRYSLLIKHQAAFVIVSRVDCGRQRHVSAAMFTTGDCSRCISRFTFLPNISIDCIFVGFQVLITDLYSNFSFIVFLFCFMLL